VLIADDRRDTLQALRMLLDSQGFTVVPAVSPIEALRAAEAHPIDAALVDLNYDNGRTSGDQGFAPDLPIQMHRQLPIVATAWATRNSRGIAARAIWSRSRGTSQLVATPAAVGQALRKVHALPNFSGCAPRDAADGSRAMRHGTRAGWQERQMLAQGQHGAGAGKSWDASAAARSLIPSRGGSLGGHVPA
jgi:ActR/RegA family two-component response regulator